MALPKDAIILLSMLNMKLRDQYPSLEALCEDLDEDREALEQLMRNAGYRYDTENNQFIPE